MMHREKEGLPLLIIAIRMWILGAVFNEYENE